jgi:hypothetical protein
MIHNIFSTGAQEQLGPEKIIEFLYRIWIILNSEVGRTPEFGRAIILFTEAALQYSRLEIFSIMYSTKPTKPNIDYWLEWSRRFNKRHSSGFSHEVELALYNVCTYYLQQGNFVELDNVLKYWDIMYKESGIHEYEVAPAYYIGRTLDFENFPPLHQLEEYKNRLELLYAKYPLEVNVPYAKILLKIYQYHVKHDTVLRPKILSKYMKRIKHLYEKHPNDDIAKILMGALILSMSKNQTTELMYKDIKQIRQLFERHKNEATKVYAMIALAHIDHHWKEFNLDDVKQDLEYMQMSTSDLDNKHGEFNFRQIVHDKDFEKELNDLCDSLVDYEIYSTESGLYVIVLDDNILHTIQLTDPAFPLYDSLLDTHVFLGFPYKDINSVEKDIILLLCPVRARKDQKLRAMLKNIVLQKTDTITTLFTQDAEIGLTNKRGISILRNPTLTQTQKNGLMEKGKCLVNIIRSRFHSIPLFYDIINDPDFSDEDLKRLKRCPYCFNADYA